MDQWSKVIVLVLSVCLVGCLSLTQAQDYSSSESQSYVASLDITDRNPCSFRGRFLVHGQSTQFDPCTLCTCKNGTTTCNIISCPSKAECDSMKIVVIPEVCCPLCPYTMIVKKTKNKFHQNFQFIEGSSNNITFDVAIKVIKTLTSSWIYGENLWKISAWISPSSNGSGERFSENKNVLSQTDAAKEFIKEKYPPWNWANLQYTMEFQGGSCAEYKYFCIKFGQAASPRPNYDLPFTFQAVGNQTKRFIDCVPIGECTDIRTQSTWTQSTWALVSILFFFLILTTALIGMAWKRKIRRAGKQSTPTSPVTTYSKIDMMKEVDPMLKSKEIHPSNIELHNELGRGKFGVVYKATVYNLEGTTTAVQAAVKTSNEKADVEEREALVEEMKLMVQLGDHPNILPLLASCSVREPYYLVTVSMKYGDLLHFLRKCRLQKNKESDSTFSVGEKEKLMIALQIAKGMAYVREQRFYHGDLAARNILVGEGLEIKISDFGLSEDLYTKGYQRRTKEQMIPIKWCSLETILHGICSSDADVWSYGVVLYEIYTLGGTPYPGIEGRFLVPKLKKGYRMEQPAHCPDYVYEVMQKCWQEDPHERIKFQEIVEKMDASLVQMTDYVQFFSEDDIMIMADNDDVNRPGPITGHDALPTDDYDEDNFAPILEEDDNINIDDLEDFMMIEGSSTTDHVIMHPRGVKNDYVES